MQLTTHLQMGKLNNEAGIIKLPYEGQRLSMYIISPAEDIKDPIGQLDQDLDPFLADQLIQLTMPKFKIESSYEMKNYLTNLGLESIFHATEADLTGLNE